MYTGDIPEVKMALVRMCVCVCVCVYVKVKQSRLEAWSGPEFSRNLRLLVLISVRG
jgi:hypothetical protein